MFIIQTAMKYQVNFCMTKYLHSWKGHCCYGYMINSPFVWVVPQKSTKMLQRNGLVFDLCLYNKQNITWPFGDVKFLFTHWKIHTHSFATLTRKIFFNTQREIFHLCAAMKYPLFNWYIKYNVLTCYCASIWTTFICRFLPIDYVFNFFLLQDVTIQF